MIWRYLDPCRAIWIESLRLPPRTMRDTLLWELETHFHISRDDALARARSATTRIADTWRQAAPKSAADVDTFYRRPLDYAFELLWWHSFATRDRTFLSVVPAARHAWTLGARRTLDFGGGVGSHALVMAALGLEVTTADVSDELLRFAAWRAAIRRRPVRTLHLDHDSLDEEYDFITAVDVLEHLPTPVETVVRLGRHLRVGGWLFLSMPAGPSPDVPQHISFWGEQLIIDSGVREVMRFGHDCFLFEKTGPFRAHGGPPCYDPLPGAIARRALLPSVSPALWFQQTRYWYRAGRP